MSRIDQGQRRREFDSLLRVYARSNSLLTGEQVTCAAANSHAPLARSSGYHLAFSYPSLQASPETDQGLRSFAGLNYHELAHALYTPSSMSKIRSARSSSEYRGVWNILEDQRVERLITARWGIMQDYLTAMVVDHFLGASQRDIMHLYVHGRTYLPGRVRREAREVFRVFYGDEVTLMVSDIIDEFIDLKMSSEQDQSRGIQLVLQLQALLRHENFDLPGDTHGEPLPEGPGVPRRDLARHEGEAHDALDEYGEPGDDDQGEEGSAATTGRAGEESSGDAGEELDDAMEEARSQVRKQTERDIQEVLSAVESQSGQYAGAKGSGIRRIDRPVNADHVDEVRRFSRVMERLRIDADPGWRRHQSSGRLNVQRAILGGSADDIWDVWDAGVSDNTDYSIAVLIDSSGSMGHHMESVCQAAWVIARAVESMRGDSLIVTFDTESSVLKNVHERAALSTFVFTPAQGGTNPKRAMQEAQKYLLLSRHRHRLLIVMTDGEWAESHQSEEIARHLRSEGVLTVLGRYGDSAVKKDGFVLDVELEHPGDISRMAKDIMTSMSALPAYST